MRKNFKKGIIFILILSSVMAFGGCKPKTPPEPIGKTAAEIVAEARKTTDEKIQKIKTTDNLKIKDGAKVYYVSDENGSDSFSGTDEEHPWKTIKKLNSENMEAGSVVCFERGNIFRGQIVAKEGVTYTAYGSGEKPMIYASPENGAVPDNWKKTSTKNVWKYSTKFTEDVGTLVFNEGESVAFKAMIQRKNGEIVFDYKDLGPRQTSKEWKGLESLNEDLYFWHNDQTYPGNTPDYYVYLYSETNPGERFWSIEFNVLKHVFSVDTANVTIDNVCVKYTGGHGVSAYKKNDPTGIENLTVQNCEFGWIGGSLQDTDIDLGGRYGNAIQILASCNGYYCYNNYIYQVYDAAITPQGNAGVHSEYVSEKNIEFADNVIEYCNYGIEYFCRNKKGVPGDEHYENFVIRDNYIWYTGSGLCEQRGQIIDSAHIKAWRSETLAQMCPEKGIQIKNNFMAYAKSFVVDTEWNSKDVGGGNFTYNGIYKDTSGVYYEGNVFVDYYAEDAAYDDSVLGFLGYEFASGKVIGVIREWHNGKSRWKDFYNEMVFYNEKFEKLVNSYGKDNKCYFLQKA